MANLRFVVSLTNNDNDYQIEQATAAREAARRLGVEVEIVHANNDPVEQSQQILRAIQSSSAGKRPDAIVVEPLGTSLPQAARAAAAAGIGWALLNRDADYIGEPDHPAGDGNISGRAFDSARPGHRGRQTSSWNTIQSPRRAGRERWSTAGQGPAVDGRDRSQLSDH